VVPHGNITKTRSDGQIFAGNVDIGGDLKKSAINARDLKNKS